MREASVFVAESAITDRYMLLQFAEPRKLHYPRLFLLLRARGRYVFGRESSFEFGAHAKARLPWRIKTTTRLLWRVSCQNSFGVADFLPKFVWCGGFPAKLRLL